MQQVDKLQAGRGQRVNQAQAVSTVPGRHSASNDMGKRCSRKHEMKELPRTAAAKVLGPQ